MAVAFLSGMNHNMYGQLMNELQNYIRMGLDQYTKDLTNAYNLEIN